MAYFQLPVRLHFDVCNKTLWQNKVYHSGFWFIAKHSWIHRSKAPVSWVDCDWDYNRSLMIGYIFHGTFMSKHTHNTALQVKWCLFQAWSCHCSLLQMGWVMMPTKVKLISCPGEDNNMPTTIMTKHLFECIHFHKSNEWKYGCWGHHAQRDWIRNGLA